MTLGDVFTLDEHDPADIVSAGHVTPGELLARWITRPEWMQHADCRDVTTGRFFPARGERFDDLRALCAECPVNAQCLDYALENPDVVGIWAGTTATERTALRRQRQTPPAA